MARGKNQARKRNAETRALQERLTALAAETATEQALMAAALGKATETAQAREALSALVERRERMLAPRVERLRAEREKQRVRAAEMGRWYDEVLHPLWEKITDGVMAAAPKGTTGTEQLEFLMAKMGTPMQLLAGPTASRLSQERRARIERLSGRRSRLVAESPHEIDRSEQFAMSRPMLARAAASIASDDGQRAGLVKGPLQDRVQAVWASDWTSTVADAIASWHPLPLLRGDLGNPYETMPVLAPITPDTAVTSLTVAHERLRAGVLRAQIRADFETLERAKALLAPWQRLPRFSRSVDAMSLRHVYALAALGTWMRAAESDVPATADPADDSTWSAPVPTPMVGVMAEVAYGLRTAAPFWLPPAQTHGFLDAEPLPQEQVAELRMPFDAQAVFFAEPLWLPPEGGQVGGADGELAEVLTQTNRETFRAFSHLYDREAGGERPDAGALLARYGGHVEGILLLGDAEGGLRDEFAWCLALDGAGPGLVAGRVVVAATMTGLSPEMAGVVRNAAAVAAWGRWHAPVDEIEMGQMARTTRDQVAARRQAAAAVRVLNVGRTSGSSADAVPSGKTVAPHRRRGHWRRQRVGAGRAQVRPVWVPPVLVNASRMLDLTPTVYRLPARWDGVPAVASVGSDNQERPSPS